MRACAVSHANIALIKYWGKADEARNLPAVPSLSLTLDALTTTTTVAFDRDLTEDMVVLGGRAAPARATARVTELLDRVRRRAGTEMRARVESANDFPTASGLASSASGFAALAAAAATAAGLERNRGEWSDLARRSSASAARSIFGGFVTLDAARPGTEVLAAEPLLAADAWDVRLIVAVATEQEKDIGSTEAMARTAKTSPFYAAWVDAAPGLFAEAKSAILRRDLEVLGSAAERSAFAMHACAIAARPAIVYWQPVTLLALACVRDLRKAGIVAFATMDAGPHVKVLTSAADAPAVERALAGVPGIVRTIIARPGSETRVEALGAQSATPGLAPARGGDAV